MTMHLHQRPMVMTPLRWMPMPWSLQIIPRPTCSDPPTTPTNRGTSHRFSAPTSPMLLPTTAPPRCHGRCYRHGRCYGHGRCYVWGGAHHHSANKDWVAHLKHISRHDIAGLASFKYQGGVKGVPEPSLSYIHAHGYQSFSTNVADAVLPC